jgi:succinate dehydrogenase / fumarate reductase membrane anchor subunit
MDYKTPLAKVRGLGSAHHGTAHWWMQRVTALVLCVLSFWLVMYSQQLSTASYEQMAVWLTQPVHGFCAISWTVAAFYHAALGLRVVIEDYVPHHGRKIVFIWSVNLIFCALAGLIILAVLKIMN